MPDHRHRVLFVASHPVQYQAPVFRRLTDEPNLEIHVAYCSLKGAETARDPEFSASFQWDVPLLDGYSWSHVPNRGSGKETLFGLINPGLWKRIRSGNYDAVVCYIGYVRATFWMALLAAKFSNTAFLFGCDQGSLAPRDGRWWKKEVKRFAWPLLYQLADHVVVSSTHASQLVQSLGIPEEHISLTPLVVDNAWWTAKAAEADCKAVRASWKVPETDVVFLFCAKLQPWKRPLDLLRAFAKAQLSNAVLAFAGEGPLRPQLEAEASALGVSSRVRMLGFVNQSQLPPVYAASDLLVLPSEFEPFGAVVNEAMCCGCVPAASDCCGSARDLVAPVSPDLVFRCGDIDALAKILTAAATDRPRLHSLARAAHAHIQTWSPERNIAATVEAVRMAVARKRGGFLQAASGISAARSVPSAAPKLRE